MISDEELQLRIKVKLAVLVATVQAAGKADHVLSIPELEHIVADVLIQHKDEILALTDTEA